MISRNSSVLYNVDNNAQAESPGENYQLYKYRFIIMLIFILAASQNIIMWSIFIPIQNHLHFAFGETLTWINFGTILISNVSYIPANFIGNYLVSTFGLRVGVITGIILSVIGLWVRTLSTHSFVWIFVGQTFAGFAQPYFYSTPQKISNVWFGISERPWATTLMVCSLTFGNAFGAIIPQFFMDLATDPKNQDPGQMRSEIHRMMNLMAYVGSGCLVLILIFMRGKPQTPSSQGAEVEAEAEKLNVSNSLKTLLKDKNVMCLLVASAIVNGSLVNYFSTINQVTFPFGITSSQISDIVCISTITGLIGSAVGATIIHRSRKYNWVIIGSGVISLIALVGNLLLVKSGPYAFGAVAVAYSVLIAPVLPVSLEYAMELSFPLAEATVGGLWFVVNQLSSTLESFVIDTILDQDGENPTQKAASIAFYITIGIQFLGVLPLFFIKENLKRTKYEQGLLQNADEEDEKDE